ncbi:MAG: DNA-3-methyladenine glycosylase [Ruminococcus sp.]|nr:DNA-3-methyladenine glycosylase [Ruminococcus sp.]
MEYILQNNGVLVKGVTDLDLAQTLDCGQSFRWTQQDDGSFSGVAFGRRVNVSLDGDRLFIRGASAEDFEKYWRGYFDLDLDYGSIRKSVAALHPVLSEAARYAPGIRILRQEPWEALCTFIISQNNNIKRIKGIVDRLCESFGEDIGGGFAFTSAEALARLSPDDLAPLRAGFRNRYIIDAAQKVASGEVDLEACRTLEYEQARRELMKITGVGVKVADCTLLFGLHRIEAFPVDVWMKRALKTLFPGMTPADFGEYAGIAQQYIFHYSRMHPEVFENDK